MGCACGGNGGCASCSIGFGSDNILSCDFAEVKMDCPTECTTFELDGSEVCFFDSVVNEQVNIIGTPIEFWHQDWENVTRDALYDEPTDRAWRGPWKLKAFVDYLPGTPEMREEGFRVTWNGTMFIPRAALESIKAPAPQEGDVIRYWSNKFFKEHASGSKGDPGADYYFDVINVDDDQHVFDSAAFMGFKLILTRRTEFGAERRLAEVP